MKPRCPAADTADAIMWLILKFSQTKYLPYTYKGYDSIIIYSTGWKSIKTVRCLHSSCVCKLTLRFFVIQNARSSQTSVSSTASHLRSNSITICSFLFVRLIACHISTSVLTEHDQRASAATPSCCAHMCDVQFKFQH